VRLRAPKHYEFPKQRRLILVPKEPTKSDNSLGLIIGFFTCVALILVFLIYLASNKKPEIVFSLDAFSSLTDVLEKEGTQTFHSKKIALKEDVARVLQSKGDSLAKQRASHIAVYLFPDLLPPDDFEKEIAQEEWAPLLAAIEKNPHTEQSRQLFEELSATIWNYENPERKFPKLSPYATEVLRIYETLSSP